MQYLTVFRGGSFQFIQSLLPVLPNYLAIIFYEPGVTFVSCHPVFGVSYELCRSISETLIPFR